MVAVAAVVVVVAAALNCWFGARGEACGVVAVVVVAEIAALVVADVAAGAVATMQPDSAAEIFKRFCCCWNIPDHVGPSHLIPQASRSHRISVMLRWPAGPAGLASRSWASGQRATGVGKSVDSLWGFVNLRRQDLSGRRATWCGNKWDCVWECVDFRQQDLGPRSWASGLRAG